MKLRTMLPRTRLEWVERLAGAGMWIAIGASVFVASTGSPWTWVLSGCIMALAVISAVAGIPAGGPAGGWCFGTAAGAAETAVSAGARWPWRRG